MTWVVSALIAFSIFFGFALIGAFLTHLNEKHPGILAFIMISSFFSWMTYLIHEHVDLP